MNKLCWLGFSSPPPPPAITSVELILSPEDLIYRKRHCLVEAEVIQCRILALFDYHVSLSLGDSGDTKNLRVLDNGITQRIMG
ncbi:hypothetical protein VNO80_19006 [Phaseolus coccineus]|uniref:Uncharacterized protein n=1 Tax=Phaseolus coccineus TaxID=3886 RepID=A0AAN9QZW7_PHACN